MNLCLIPNLKVKADSGYSAETSFHYTYDGYQYWFYFDGSLDTVSDYYFQSDALNTIIEKTAEYYNVSITSILGNKIDFVLSGIYSSMYNTLRNWIIGSRVVVADWFTSEVSIYGWTFEFTGLDSDYPGFETYGPAYGWRFTGSVGDKTDIVLDQYGHLYGSTPIGNVTGSDDINDFAQWSIHQFDDDDIWYQPSFPTTLSFNDLAEPYIDGKSLIWSVYNGGSPYRFKVTNFVDTYISVNYSSYNWYPIFYFYSPSASDTSYSDLVSLDGFSYREKGYAANGNYNNVLYISFRDHTVDHFNLPCQYRGPYGTNWNLTSIVNCRGMYNQNYVQQNTHYIYLSALTTTPVPNMPSVPSDDPVPFSSLDPDPEDYVPEDDPDPVPGIDYPVPEPTPVPVPQLPSIVSGNDDLWPDMNGFFDAENDLDGFLGPLRDFDFGSFSNITAQFSSALVWVSTIMMTLFDGSDFNILFSILAVFFIACALLGIYKWWNS